MFQYKNRNILVLLFDTNSGSFSTAYAHYADDCYCYLNLIYQQVDGDDYWLDFGEGDGGIPLIIEVLESGNISVTFEL